MITSCRNHRVNGILLAPKVFLVAGLIPNTGISPGKTLKSLPEAAAGDPY